MYPILHKKRAAYFRLLFFVEQSTTLSNFWKEDLQTYINLFPRNNKLEVASMKNSCWQLPLRCYAIAVYRNSYSYKTRTDPSVLIQGVLSGIPDISAPVEQHIYPGFILYFGAQSLSLV